MTTIRQQLQSISIDHGQGNIDSDVKELLRQEVILQNQLHSQWASNWLYHGGSFKVKCPCRHCKKVG